LRFRGRRHQNPSGPIPNDDISNNGHYKERRNTKTNDQFHAGQPRGHYANARHDQPVVAACVCVALLSRPEEEPHPLLETSPAEAVFLTAYEQNRLGGRHFRCTPQRFVVVQLRRAFQVVQSRCPLRVDGWAHSHAQPPARPQVSCFRRAYELYRICLPRRRDFRRPGRNGERSAGETYCHGRCAEHGERFGLGFVGPS
jgi:hypothetical protein